MLTVGVDLAAEGANTALAHIRWSIEGATVEHLVVGVDDGALLTAVAAADKAGIDCPLGWPALFVEFVSAHEAGRLVEPEDIAGREWRRQLAYRRTDLLTREITGIVPLSVSADRIGHTAMRCAGLLARMARNGLPVDRGGCGVVVEVYPAASLKLWGLPHRGYKGRLNRESLQHLVDALLSATPWLDLGGFEAMCRRSDHAIDAILASLTARAASQGLTTRPPEEHMHEAGTEGWIALPTSPLDALRP